MSKFDESSTAFEVIADHDLNGYEIIVTGALLKIGTEAASAFAKAGARIILADSDLQKLEEKAKEIKEKTRNNKIEVERLELDSLEKINEFIHIFLKKKRPLHILLNSANVKTDSLSFTKNGFELQFGTNYIGHFALTHGLIPALKHAAKISGKKSRVISVSSLAHINSDIDLNDMNFCFLMDNIHQHQQQENKIYLIPLTTLKSNIYKEINLQQKKINLIFLKILENNI